MTKSCTRRDPDGTPGSLDDPAHAGGPAPTDPDLGFLWSGRRDSNPRPPPWQNSAAQMRHQRKLPKMNADVQVRNRSHLVVSCCFPVSCGLESALVVYERTDGSPSRRCLK